jgi:hypothetical protein
LGESEQATRLCADGLSLARELAWEEGIADGLGNLSLAALQQGHYEQALPLLEEALTSYAELEYLTGNRVLQVAAVDASQGEVARATRLLAGAEALRNASGLSLETVERELNDRTVSSVHEQLGEEAFAAAWSTGSAMSPDETVAYALETLAAAARGHEPSRAAAHRDPPSAS